MEMAEALHEQDIPTAYGGRVFMELPQLRQHIRGHYLGDDLSNVADAVEYALVAPPPAAPVLPSADLGVSLDHFRDRALAIEMEIIPQVGPTVDSEDHLRIAISEMRRHIIASLKLCDASYTDFCLDWIEALMVNRGLSADELHRFIESYRNAALKHLDSRGQPILQWLASRLDQLPKELARTEGD
jgi:hypothetical protein